MSPLLWATIVVAIIGSATSIVIAIVGTIEDKDRRQMVVIIIYAVLLATGITCGVLFRIHHAHHVDDAEPPVETERISESRDRDVLR